MDFTFYSYENLLKTLIEKGFLCVTFSELLKGEKSKKLAVLRYDTETRYENALKFAEIQRKYGLRGTYFFRFLKRNYNKDIIKEIASLGHEIGYHYDDLVQSKGDFQKAVKGFEKNLQILRDIAAIKTICMEGAPLSRFDNKSLWKEVNYADYGIIGEPYFDVDFNKVFYLTDTGRCWDGWKMSVRDKVPQQKDWIRKGWVYHSTKDIIMALNSGTFPEQIMITFHPQRWNDKPLPWMKELVWQNIKNIGKRILVRVKGENSYS